MIMFMNYNFRGYEATIENTHKGLKYKVKRRTI